MKEVYIQNFTLVQDENGKYHPVMKLEAVTDEMLKQQTKSYIKLIKTCKKLTNF